MNPVIKNDLLIVVPMYNEVESIALMIQKLKPLNIPFIIIDNHSTDGCREIAENLNVEVLQRGEYGTGYGCAILKGLQVAQERGYRYLGTIDCDVTYNPKYFLEMKRYIDNHHTVMGVRRFKDITFIRRTGNTIHTFIANGLFFSSLKDINTGLRIVNVNVFIPYVKEKNMGMMPQMSVFALRNKLKIKEIEIDYQPRLGLSKLNKIKDGLVILIVILKERIKKRVYLSIPPLE